MKHRTTDPACSNFRPPRTPFGRWRYNRARSRSCPVCMTPQRVVRRMADDLRRRIDEGNI